MALFGGLWLAVVFGVPPFFQIVTRLPVFSLGHNTPSDRALRAGAGAAGGLGARRPGRRGLARARPRVALALAGAAVLLPALFIVAARRTSSARSGTPSRSPGLRGPARRLPQPQRRAGLRRALHRAGDVIRLASLIVWLTVAGAGCVLLWLRFSGGSRSAGSSALAVLLVCSTCSAPAWATTRRSIATTPSQPATPAVRLLERHSSARFVSTEPVPQNVIPLKFGLDEARGYDFPIIRRFDTLLAARALTRVAFARPRADRRRALPAQRHAADGSARCGCSA